MLQISAGIQNHPDTWTFWTSWRKLWRWTSLRVLFFRHISDQCTQWVPPNTVIVANIPHMHITIGILGICHSLRHPFFQVHKGGMEKNNFDGFSSIWLRNFHFYPRSAPWGSIGQANKTSPRFYTGQTIVGNGPTSRLEVSTEDACKL